MFALIRYPVTRLVPLLWLLDPGTVTSCRVATAPGTGELRVQGTIRFVDLEGGCWQLQADDGGRYELRPDQAPAAILRDGARVVLLLAPRPDLASVCQVGAIADVERVERRRVP